MGSCGKFSRSQYVRAIDSLCRKREPNRATLDNLLHKEEQKLEKNRAEFWAVEKDMGLKEKVQLLQTNISYIYRNPWHAKQAILHDTMNPLTKPSIIDPSSLEASSYTHFKTMEYQGDGVMRLAATRLLTNSRPKYSSSTEYKRFPSSLTSKLIDSIVSNDYLARVAVKLKLWDILKFRYDRRINVCEVKEFLDSVQEDRYDVKAPKILADAVEATAGSVYVDSDSIEVFSRVWEPLFFFEENPMYRLLTSEEKHLVGVSPFFRSAGKHKVELFSHDPSQPFPDKITNELLSHDPSQPLPDKITNELLSHDPSQPLPSAPKVLGSGITKLAAVADALNKPP